MDTDNSMVITRGEGVGQVEEGEVGINGDGRRLRVVNTQYCIQMMYHSIVHLKPG